MDGEYRGSIYACVRTEHLDYHDCARIVAGVAMTTAITSQNSF